MAGCYFVLCVHNSMEHMAIIDFLEVISFKTKFYSLSKIPYYNSDTFTGIIELTPNIMFYD